ncbi:uncharacterized protein K02A2.6-like [Wyeomyia smithii]|uniref:uncharacterized protein K02A2.6-like n=1 Tax=Wyeomyia smithii TaxID=174621 RepID=UPI002467D9AB|nr:uncharacterized protein K02A2.6-like [Wyeomyia smithii]
MIILVSVDHYSNYFDVDFLNSQNTSAVLECSKRNFSRLGIPRQVITDSGKQFTSQKWQQFVKTYGIRHTTSAPYHHEANGKAESSIKIAKNVLKKALEDGKDIWLALLEWRNTPQADGYSPIQKLMGRSSRGLFPLTQKRLKLMPIDGNRVREEIELRKVKSKFYHDRRSQELPSLVRGQEVYVQLKPESSSEWTRGKVNGILSDRDYLIDVRGAEYRRNRRNIRDSYASLDSGTRENSSAFNDISSPGFEQDGFGRTKNHYEWPGNDTAVAKSETSTSNQPVYPEADKTNQLGETPRRPVRLTRRPLRFDDYVLEE